jgi:fatty acid desaturase
MMARGEQYTSSRAEPRLAIERIPNPAEPVPLFAWPTLALFGLALSIWIGSSALAISGSWAWPISVAFNWLAVYLLFTVSHEASHFAAASSRPLNNWLGRIATFFVGPIGFPVWRYVHMQHHRFVNVAGADPDYPSSHSTGWQRPVRWLTMDINYLRFYVPRLATRPTAERREMALTIATFIAAAVATIEVGWGWWFVALVLVPARLNSLGLGWAFDYLPHCRLRPEAEDSRFRTTRNRVGLEPLLTPLTLYQNYHLVHHLHPRVPFYRYIAVWRRRERDYLKHQPALSTVRGRPLTADEYERLRALQH